MTFNANYFRRICRLADAMAMHAGQMVTLDVLAEVHRCSVADARHALYLYKLRGAFVKFVAPRTAIIGAPR